MRWPRRDTLIPLALGALAFVVAFVQRPGLEVAETKVDLHVAPGSFLRDVLSAWTPSGSLGPRLRRPVRRLPVADGAVLRPRRPRRPARLGRRAAVDRRGAGAQRVGDGAPARRARRAPARRRPPGRRAALHAQPVRRHLRGADVDHAAGHGGAAVAAAVRAPRTARSPRLVVAGGLRARADLDRRRGQRRRHRLAAARPRAAGGLRAGLGRGGVGRGARGSWCGSCRWRRSPGCGGSRPCSSTRATAWTSCPTPSSRGRSGARRRCPSRCGCWASGRATSASATRARCAPSRPTPASTSGSRRSWWRRWPSPRCAWARSPGRGARATRPSSSPSSSSACW